MTPGGYGDENYWYNAYLWKDKPKLFAGTRQLKYQPGYADNLYPVAAQRDTLANHK